jgi:hypothetical protein
MTKKLKRTSQALRDVLFDEIEELRNGAGDPSKAMAVANLAKQIINVAKVELDYHRMALQHAEAGSQLQLGAMNLGSDAASVAPNARDHTSGSNHQDTATPTNS